MKAPFIVGLYLMSMKNFQIEYANNEITKCAIVKWGTSSKLNTNAISITQQWAIMNEYVIQITRCTTL